MPMFTISALVEMTIDIRGTEEDAKKKAEQLYVCQEEAGGDWLLKAFTHEVLTISPFNPNPRHRNPVEGEAHRPEEIPKDMGEGSGRNNEPAGTTRDLDIF